MAVKKVLCHINSMSRGGAERVMSVLVDSMIEDGIEVVLVTLSRAENEYSVYDEVKRIVIDEAKEYNNSVHRTASRYLALRKIIKAEKPDIVISFTVNENLRATIAMQGINIPLLVSVRNDPTISYASKELLIKFMEKKASGCVFQTRQARDYFSDSLKEKSRIILNPLDDKYLNNADEHTNYLRELKSDTRSICSVGRISAQKNQLLLVKAFANVIKKQFDCNWVLKIYGGDFGDGTKVSLDRYIEDNSLQDKVLFMGVSDKIEQELAKSDIFVLSSDYEGMPNALMEAMATGLPVISTDCPCGGPADIIIDKENGLLVPVGDEKAMTDALECLLNDEQLRNIIGKNAANICKDANKTSVYRQWKAYMDSLCSN